MANMGLYTLYSLLFAGELIYLVGCSTKSRSGPFPCLLNFLYLWLWFRWFLAVQVMSPRFQWTPFLGLVFWCLELGFPLTVLRFRAAWAVHCVWLSCVLLFMYSLEDNSPELTARVLAATALGRVLVGCVLFVGDKGSHTHDQGGARKREQEAGRGGWCLKWLPLFLQALCWSLWSLALHAGRPDLAFLARFGCTASLGFSLS